MPGLADTHHDEREQLLAYLAQQRYFVRLAAFGLTDEQARSTPSASSLSVGGLIKHLVRVEGQWIDIVRQRSGPSGADRVTSYLAGFRMAPEETLAGLLDEYRAVAAETDRLCRELPVDHPVPVPQDVPWFPADGTVWTLRWVLLHLIEETARHAGHTDIVRESIDGATWFPLMAAAEGSSPSPWIEPWRPPDARQPAGE